MVLPLDTVTKSAEETKRLGAQFGHFLLAEKRTAIARVVCLWGELGSGKTTFTQGLAQGFGVTARLLSPTFIIVRRYEISKMRAMFFHMDLYRLQKEEDVNGLGFSEILQNPNAFVSIEWPERLGSLLPENRIDVTFSVLPDGRHEIDIRSNIKARMSNET